jgi:TRAP-type C4-dicarboxylate transport system substrate-binding protein
MHRRQSLSPTVALLAIFAVVLATAGCSGSGGDKAGGARVERPTVLTLANHEGGSEDFQHWVEEVQRRSAGSLRIEVSPRWRDDATDYDKATIADVQAGKVQLAKVSARAYDTVGVDSFQALLAPLLIDNQTLEQRVLESELASAMLAGVDRLGLVGLAVLPTGLRKPLGLRRPLVTVQDYRDARIAVTEGEVARATFVALGATPVRYPSGGSLSAFDGAELGLNPINGNGYDRGAHSLTANVTFWPKPVTIVANRKLFDSLTTGQQDALRRAGSSVISRQVKSLQELNIEDRSSLCRRQLHFVHASTQDLAALRRAVQPVHDDIGRNPASRSHLQRILTMKREAGASTPDAPRCSPAEAAVAPGESSPTLDGVYTGTVTKVPDGWPVDENLGDYKLTFASGRFQYAQDSPSGPIASSGTYTVDKREVMVNFDAGYNQGSALACEWSIYKDTLTLRDVPSASLECGFLRLTTWRRVG